MAANKFASTLHRYTNKLTLILIYAGLEWTLILLLFLNSLFSCLIMKFADYFGLKPPCSWCSRIDDRIFETGKKRSLHRDHLCEVHATEISRLGYCSNHKTLAVYEDMCEDCSSSRPDFHEVSKSFDFLPFVKQYGKYHSDENVVAGKDEITHKCSCCGVNVEKKTGPPYILINPSMDVLDCLGNQNMIAEVETDYHNSEEKGNFDRFEDNRESERKSEDQVNSDVNEEFGEMEKDVEADDKSVSEPLLGLKDFEDDKEPIKMDNSYLIFEDQISNEIMSLDADREEEEEEESREILPQHLEFFIDCSGHQLVPIELFDSPTEEKSESRCGHQLVPIELFHSPTEEKSESRCRNEEHEESPIHVENKLGSQSLDQAQIEPIEELKSSVWEQVTQNALHVTTAETSFAVFESMEIENTDNSLVFHCGPVYEQVALPNEKNSQSHDIDNTLENEVADVTPPPVSEDESHMHMSETEADVSIGTEIPDLDLTVEIQAQESLSSYSCTHEDPSTSSASFCRDDDHGIKEIQEEKSELKNVEIEAGDHDVPDNQLPYMSELNEAEEEKFPDTPTSVENLHHLHKKLLLGERKEFGGEESLDGSSVLSEFESGEGVITVERLTSALKSERKALNALYAELEDERSASAVAASQTMAMINRLQEEKAAMQMEALQYQRMMEEQSEYDQEALQLLNELMVKREKEKQELERELELYRKRVSDYEARERMRILRRSKDGSARSATSCASFSNADDSDEISIDLNHDLNQEPKEEYQSNDSLNVLAQESENQSTPVEAVLNFRDSFADFEEERLSILEQLKVLEEKLLTLSDAEGQHFEDVRPIEDFYKENGKHSHENSDSDHDELANGFSEEMNGNGNGKYHYQEGRIMGAKAKRLLPLFDAISTESDDGEFNNGHENGFHSNKFINSNVARLELENKRVAIEEEVDQVYERLQALEADRGFLKNCVSSLKKGDKGMDLLQEILGHLRDLRDVELRARSLSDGSLA